MTIESLKQSLLGACIPVLCYHQVLPGSAMTPEKFSQHLDLIKMLGFETISLTDLHQIILGQKKPSGRSLVITFDDCTLDNWVYALPELLRKKMTATFFSITDFLKPGNARLRSDQSKKISIPEFGKIMRLAIKGDTQYFMNFDEICSMVHEFGMEVYPHSATHQACFIETKPVGVLADSIHWSHNALCGSDAALNTTVYPVGSAYAHAGFGLKWNGKQLALKNSNERLKFCLEDFSRSKMQLESILSKPCDFLCLPWGQYDDVTLQAARKAGYSAVLTLDCAAAGTGTDSFRIGRRAIKGRKSLAWLTTRLLLDSHGKKWKKS